MGKVEAPYPGQGLPLPQGMGLTGAWVIENIVAITIDEPATPDGDGVFQRAPKSPKGNNVFTFDAKTIAEGFNVTVETLLRENAAGLLLFSFEDTGSQTAVCKFMYNFIEISIRLDGLSEQ